MKLLFKVNILLVIVFLLGLAASYTVAERLLLDNARSEIQDNARIMMESALAVRAYTVSQIKPLLDTQMRYQFLPQTVPSYWPSSILTICARPSATIPTRKRHSTRRTRA